MNGISNYKPWSLNDLPKNVMLLGYGAIGKCFTEMLLKDYPSINLIVVDLFDYQDNRFLYLKFKVTKDNIPELLKSLNKGDILIDLSVCVDFIEMWKNCMEREIMYLNTACEEWGDSEDPITFPETQNEMYLTSIAFLHDKIERSEYWKVNTGTTAVIEHGMNPGLISHFSKKAILDFAEYTLKTLTKNSDLDLKLIQKLLNDKNYSKLAQALGLHSIHCSEIDDQLINPAPKDIKTKFYNTWSCIGFLTEALIPIQVSCGSHETILDKEFPVVRDGTCIMSWGPSYLYEAKSWVPFQNIEGLLIPHGESFTIQDFFRDKETGYAPSHYFVYDVNPYAKTFIKNIPIGTTLQKCNPIFEVMEPKKYELKGCDKVGALMLFNENRGWWTGSIMNEVDASSIFEHKFGPTVIQVAAGCYACFQWMCRNKNSGCHWPDSIDSEFVIEAAKPYLGRIHSGYVDLNETHLKDCYRFQDFLTKRFQKEDIEDKECN